MRISDWSSDVCSSDLAYLVDGADEIDPQWLEGRRHIGVTAGASAPDILVQGVIERLHALGAGAGVRELSGEPENMGFALPKELREIGRAAWRERGGQSGSVTVGGVSLNKKNTKRENATAS